MKKEQIYHQIKTWNEEIYDETNEKEFQQILKEITCNNSNLKEKIESIFGDYQEVFNTLHLSVFDDTKSIKDFYQAIEKHNYQFYHSLLLFISDICNTSYDQTEQYLIKKYQNSPYIHSIEKENDTYTLTSTIGKIHFQKAPIYFFKLQNTKLEKVAKQGIFSDFCHDGTYFVTNNLEDSSACTALLPQAFYGTFYHSYTYHNGQIIDLNYNCVIPQEEYIKLVQPQIIQKIPHKELEKTLKSFHNFNAPLLYCALENQRKTYQKK